MTKHIVFFRDGGTPPELINHINNLGGALITNPRPDMRGDFVVTDIMHANLHTTNAGWAATAILRVEKYVPPQTAAVAQSIKDNASAALSSLSSDILN